MKMKSVTRRGRKLMFALRTGSLKEKLGNWIVEHLPLYHISSPYVHNRQMLDWAYRKLEREYASLVAAAPEPGPKGQGEIPKIVWWCWLQGLDAAPELAQTCLESVRRHMPGYELRIVTEQNFGEYIQLPEHVLRRRADGLMSPNHFANLLRLELLLRYGGVWIDATVLLTGDGLRRIIERSQDLFMPTISYNFYGFTAENWLIAARPDNDILRLTQQLHYAYWKDHKLALNYWFFFLFFTMAAKRYEEQWRAVYPYCREQSFLLVEELDRPFCRQRYDEIREITSFHKLSWKQKFDAPPGSYYDVLIRRREY